MVYNNKSDAFCGQKSATKEHDIASVNYKTQYWQNLKDMVWHFAQSSCIKSQIDIDEFMLYLLLNFLLFCFTFRW